MPAQRPATLVVAWSPPAGSSSSERVHDLARILGGEVALIYPVPGNGAARKTLRYLASVPLTFVAIFRARPRSILAKNPPMFCAFFAYVAARMLRIPYVLDSHPGGFGLQGDTLSLRLQPILRWLVPRARATMVTEATLKAQVDAWGGEGLVFHEAPPVWKVEPRPTPRGGPLRVFYVGTFQRDEPTPVVFDAARAMPGAEFTVTGKTELADPALLASAPPNVTFCGYLDQAGYVQALADTDLVLVLPDAATSVARSGYDAVWAHRPLVISDTPASRSAFPFATFVANDAAVLAAALEQAATRLASLEADTVQARERAEAGWTEQCAALMAAVGVAESAA